MVKLKNILFLLVYPLLITAQTIDTTKIPDSRYFEKARVFAEGNSKELFVWAGQKSENLQTTLEAFPYVACVEFRFILLNNSNKQVNVRPTDIIVDFKDGTNDKIFSGERWKDPLTGGPGSYVHLGPYIIELNNQDVSLLYLDSINLSKDDYTLLGASFEVGEEETYEDFIARIKGFTIKVQPFKEESFNLTINVIGNK